jgi:hypothetical protein
LLLLILFNRFTKKLSGACENWFIIKQHTFIGSAAVPEPIYWSVVNGPAHARGEVKLPYLTFTTPPTESNVALKIPHWFVSEEKL